VLAVAVLGLSTAWSGAAAASPRTSYMIHCMGCHLDDGRGAPGKVPSLVDSMGRFLAVPGGRAYLVQVPGTAQAPLGDGEIAALLNWMLAAFSAEEIPADFQPYSAEEVSRLRRSPLLDAERVRRALLQALDSGASDAEAGHAAPAPAP
jgi:hypothetical protein